MPLCMRSLPWKKALVQKKQQLTSLFQIFDEDGDGTLSKVSPRELEPTWFLS